MLNPLLSDYSIPPFEVIKPEHFEPAFDVALEHAREALNNVVNNTDTEDFKNAVLPYDTLFDDLIRIMNILGVYELNAYNDEIKDISEIISSKFSDFEKEVFQNPVTAKRFQDVYDKKDSLDLDEQDKWFLQNTFWEFEAAGSLLDKQSQTELKEIDQKLINLATKFNKNLDKAQIQQAFLVTNIDDLYGIPDDVMSQMRDSAQSAGYDTGWLFTPERLLVGDMLCVAHNRDFRKKIHDAMYNVGRTDPYNNRPIIQSMQKLRDARAKLLGYETYAEYHLSSTMAGNAPRVKNLIEKTISVLKPIYEADIENLQSWVTARNNTVMQPWDMSYYSMQYKQEKFNFDESELKKYFELENVLQGWIGHAEKSMNVTIEPVTDLLNVHDDVRAYRVQDHDSGKNHILYIDLYARPETKSGGAWMHGVQMPDTLLNRPNIVMLSLNLPKASGSAPSLMNISQVETLYHEGGHGLNGLKAMETKYKSRRGVTGSSDFYEIPSMIDENWCTQSEVLATYAFHHETADLVPNEIIQSMKESSKFMGSAELLLMVQNSLRDIEFHTMDPLDYIDDVNTENLAKLDVQYIDLVRPYPLARFDHLFGDGLSSYASGYYGYFWSGVAQAQAFAQFENNGLYADESSNLKNTFFSVGGSIEPNTAFENFAGLPAGDPIPLLRTKGLVQ